MGFSRKPDTCNTWMGNVPAPSSVFILRLTLQIYGSCAARTFHAVTCPTFRYDIQQAFARSLAAREKVNEITICSHYRGNIPFLEICPFIVVNGRIHLPSLHIRMLDRFGKLVFQCNQALEFFWPQLWAAFPSLRSVRKRDPSRTLRKVQPFLGQPMPSR